MKLVQMASAMLYKGQINIKKVRNIASNEISRLRKKETGLRPPSLVILEPACLCNLKCRLCKLGNDNIKRKKGVMKLNIAKKIIDEIGDNMLVVLFTNWGEPFLNINLLDMTTYASKKGIYTKINTNGHFIDTREMCEKIISSGLDEINIALDGLTEEIYLENRIKGDFNAVKRGMILLSDVKKEKQSKSPSIEMLFIISRKNESQRSAVPGFAKSLGVDGYIIKTANLAYVPDENRDEFLTESNEYSRYGRDKVTLKEKEIAGCMRAWHSAVVLWDGKVVPCCNDDEGNYTMGDLNKESFEQIWNGEKYREFRHLLLTNKDKIPMCQDCPGTLLWKSVKYERTVN